MRTGADFMATYREPRTKLPAPSFDLWEERRGIHAFTTAAVWAGLTAARNFAVAFGQHELAKRYAVAAQEIRDAALVHLWDAERGRFVRTINVLPDGTIVKDATIDISLAGLFLFGLLPATDERIRSTMRAIGRLSSERRWLHRRYETTTIPDPSDIAKVPAPMSRDALAERTLSRSRRARGSRPTRAYLDWWRASRAAVGEPLRAGPSL